jgi:transcriptional regulator with XRE-family HTH domain
MFNPDRLRNARLGKGITREQIAAHLGVGASTIDRWEKGATEPSATQLGMIAKFYDRTVDYFLRGNARATG